MGAILQKIALLKKVLIISETDCVLDFSVIFSPEITENQWGDPTENGDFEGGTCVHMIATNELRKIE